MDDTWIHPGDPARVGSQTWLVDGGGGFGGDIQPQTARFPQQSDRPNLPGLVGDRPGQPQPQRRTAACGRDPARFGRTAGVYGLVRCLPRSSGQAAGSSGRQLKGSTRPSRRHVPPSAHAPRVEPRHLPSEAGVCPMGTAPAVHADHKLGKAPVRCVKARRRVNGFSDRADVHTAAAERGDRPQAAGHSAFHVKHEDHITIHAGTSRERLPVQRHRHREALRGHPQCQIDGSTSARSIRSRSAAWADS